MAMNYSTTRCVGGLSLLLMMGLTQLATAQQPPTPEGPIKPDAPDVGVPDVNARAGGDRPTVQRRFAEKAKLLTLNLALMTHVRDDFYDSWGAGADLSYFVSERWGFEARAIFLRTQLDSAAFDLKERIGFVPDARPQDNWFLLGARYSPGYGKLLMWQKFMVHFDPQFVVHAGVATAEKRVLPTTTLAFSLMTHWRWGIKAKVDLGMSVQGEKRDRGWVVTTGFVPVFGLGWGRNF